MKENHLPGAGHSHGGSRTETQRICSEGKIDLLMGIFFPFFRQLIDCFQLCLSGHHGGEYVPF